MWITFMLSGGFAGQIRGCRIDTRKLCGPERSELEALVAASGLAVSFERVVAEARDRRQYDLAIEQMAAFVRMSCDDASLPESARPLIAELVRRSTPQPLTFFVPDAAEHAAAHVVQGDADPWGRFVGDVISKWDPNGRDMTLVAPFAYVDPRGERWDAPSGASVNGASIPRAFWSLIGGPFEGRFRNASVVHDVACMTRDRPWPNVHRMFHDACRCGGVAAVKASAMYYAVYHFGPRWRVEDRRTIVGGTSHLERVVHDETPSPPTIADARAVEEYFETHAVPVEDVPTLVIPGVGP